MGRLTLNRRNGESLVIVDTLTGERITLRVTDRGRGHTTLAIDAAQRFRIWRSEICPDDPAESAAPLAVGG